MSGLRHRPTHPVSRRAILRGAGVALTLPLLDAMIPLGGLGKSSRAAESKANAPRRLIAICTPYGIHATQFVPQETGAHYTLTPYLEHLADFRQDFTVISGVSHPDVDGAHASEATFLTAAPHPGSTSFRNSISLDQFAAERLGPLTRFPNLNLATVGTRGLSWTASGVQIPADNLPSQVYAKLFLAGSKEQVAEQVRRLRQGRSILDTVREHARRLERKVGPRDQEKLDQYFSSVRKLESEMAKSEEWTHKPKPRVEIEPPQDVDDPSDIVGRTRLMNQLARLAIQTDSTRLVTLFVSGVVGVPPIEGVAEPHHALSHHGNQPEKLDQMHRIESAQMQEVALLLQGLKETNEQGETLLDRTMVLYGSNLGNANNHSTKNMPILLAGGGFRHRGHLAFDQQNNAPLPNLFVSLLQRLGLEVDQFASSTGTMTGIS